MDFVKCLRLLNDFGESSQEILMFDILVFQHSSSVPVKIVPRPSFSCPRCLLWTPQLYLSFGTGDFCFCVECAVVCFFFIHDCIQAKGTNRFVDRNVPLKLCHC